MFLVVKRKYKYIVVFVTITTFVLFILNEQLGMYSLGLFIGLIYYYACYQVMFKKEKVIILKQTSLSMSLLFGNF